MSETEAKPEKKPRKKVVWAANDPRRKSVKAARAAAAALEGTVKGRKSSKSALRKEFPPDRWHPELVGSTQQYPKTEEAWARKREINRIAMIKKNAAGVMGRRGVPDGWGGRADECAALRQAAFEDAKEIVSIMIEQGIVSEDAAANEALQFAVSAVRGKSMDEKNRPLFGPRERLAAARLVLDFTKAKPAQKSEIALTKAEDFLAALVEKNDR